MSKEKKPLDDGQRVAAAMIAAGRSPRVAECLPEKYRTQLAALCGVDGKVVESVRDKVITILRAAGQENKATIEGAEDES